MKKSKSDQRYEIDSIAWMTSIIELTEHQNYIPLTQAFLDKLNSIFSIHKVNVYEVFGNVENISANALLLKDVLDILSPPVSFYERISQHITTLNSKQSQVLLEKNIQQAVFPIRSSSNIQRILVIDWINIHPGNWAHILKLLQVYNNLLNIIDEKDRDRLTGLLNRHTFDNNLENIIRFSVLQSKKTRGNNDNSWVAMLDIDHFKQVNDNFGHIMGDEILLLFSRFLLSSFRYSDIVFRFGGEEFIVVLTGCDKQGVENALNRFRKTIENYPFPQVGRVTVSAGYALLDVSQPPNILLDQADQALYQAKETGRNKVVYYQDIADTLNKVDLVDDVEIF